MYTVESLPGLWSFNFLYLLCWLIVCILGKKMVVRRRPAIATMATAIEGSWREAGAK